MPDKPEFFWSPPDGAPIIGVTTFEGNVLVATASGVYVITRSHWAPDEYYIHKISAAVRRNEEPCGRHGGNCQCQQAAECING